MTAILPEVLYGFESLVCAIKGRTHLRMFKNKVPRRIFERESQKVTEK
jgi:hypothetical protein